MDIRIGRVALLMVTTAAAARSVVPCDIVVPVLDANRHTVTASAPDGHSYPVFQAASPGQLADDVRRELETSFAQQALRLDRYARNFMLAKQGGDGVANKEWLTSPMYLLLSTEDGGFARFGFWLQDAAGKRRLVLSGYVDLVVRKDSVASGDLEEIFPHELGHLMLKTLTGGLEAGQSRKMHQSMTVTDYPTAFDEGYAEHFQPLVRDATKNPSLRRLESGTGPTDFELLWLSAADAQLRTDGVKRNRFIHRKPVPEIALDAAPDLYRLFVSAETSTVFLPAELKNGQQMMASEGVIATLFYRMVNDAQLRSHYREPSFYRAFLPDASDRPENRITPYENVNVKLFAAMADLRNTGRSQPHMIALVKQYARLFPDEAKRIVSVFIETTWGATASRQLAQAIARSAEDGGRGNMQAFREDRPFSLLNSTIAEVAAGNRALDQNLGPEIWIVNRDFKIAPAVWNTERTLPLTINLNTATEPELMTTAGIDLNTARKVLAARSARDFFNGLDDLKLILSPDITVHLNSMAEEMKRLPPYRRD
jgi:hypothetical protein